MKLKIAAKIGDDDRAYFHEMVEPHIDGDTVEYVGEINEEEKTDFLGKAAALVFPIDWPEPFGLVVIEAMAFGTPAIVWNEGAMPEVVDDGVTGFVVDSIERAVGRRWKSSTSWIAAGFGQCSKGASRQNGWSSDYEAIYAQMCSRGASARQSIQASSRPERVSKRTGLRSNER